MFLFLFSLVFSTDICPLPDIQGYNLTKYTRPDCPYCEKVTPSLNELEDRIKENGVQLTMLNVDCSKCDCTAYDVISVPTVVLRNGKDEVARIKGSTYMNYEDLVDFLEGHAQIDIKMFNRTQIIKDQVQILYEKDFYSGFEGPWLILFYKNKKEIAREMMKEMGKIFEGKLNVAEISAENSHNLVHRYNITSYPAILGLYDGLVTGFMDQLELRNLVDFADKLVEPSFKEINLEEFEEIAKKDEDEPIFVVFYTNISLANSYFKRAAHEYKMKSKIYKSDDKAFFNRAMIHPKEQTEENNVGEEETIVLTVYKDKIFHRCPSSLSDPNGIAEWLFHSSFPHVSKITNSNFFTVFHGLKPVVLLLSKSDDFLKEYEAAAKKFSVGLPYTDELYATIDVDEFPLFAPNLLPGINIPSIIIFDPGKQVFYHKPTTLNKESLFEYLFKTLEDYREGRLDVYPSRIKYERYIIIVLVLVAILSLGKRMLQKNKKSD
ncbi:Thioredoxin [Spraguea lophii 42_110]|uniref:Thioredoxin n=1 Tax=Spraguea lophii (strain 42_110) TaxID=1358809 RepID=S7W9Z2_SPRLO|nr:Thioredoxin [Spraguea lophii 42_110]